MGRGMLPSIIASAIAADSLGFHGAAATIREQQLGPQAIARLFASGASKGRGKVLAVVLLAGSVARYNVCREGFTGDLERDLAVAAVGDGAGFTKANREAVAIVRRHWGEIAAA